MNMTNEQVQEAFAGDWAEHIESCDDHANCPVCAMIEGQKADDQAHIESIIRAQEHEENRNNY